MKMGPYPGGVTTVAKMQLSYHLDHDAMVALGAVFFAEYWFDQDDNSYPPAAGFERWARQRLRDKGMDVIWFPDIDEEVHQRAWAWGQQLVRRYWPQLGTLP